MGDVRELLARLNTQAAAFGAGGGGGIPELTPQDIAGALGMVEAGVGRDLLCWFYGSGRERPESPERLPALLDAVLVRMIAEQRRGQDYAVADAAMNLELAEAMARACNRVSDDQKHRLRRLTDDLAIARRRRWPADSHVYPRLRAAVAHELDGGDRCSACEGRGIMIRGHVRSSCQLCNGMGRRGCSGRQRARWLAVGETTYRLEWRSPYEWLYASLRDALIEATFRLRETLG